MFKWERHNFKEKWTAMKNRKKAGKYDTHISAGIIAVIALASLVAIWIVELVKG